MLFNYPALFTDFLVSLLLFLSAFFIMLVLHVNHSLIIRLTIRTLELKDFSEKIWLQTESLKSSKQQLESIKAILEQKNKELQSALQRTSARGIEEAKSIANKEAGQEKVAEAEQPKIEPPDKPVKTFQA
jgi:biopolymer transport protein ExbB/TolQ